MSVREYIGARYVPLFADPIEWDNTKTYEPLTIVYYQGNSYTSRQAVPTGIAITNETYWALTGNYNAQIEAYREEVAQYAEEVGEFDSRLDNVEDALPLSAFDDTNTIDARFDIIETNGWVTADRLANNSVTTNKIADESITTDKLAPLSVTKDIDGNYLKTTNIIPICYGFLDGTSVKGNYGHAGAICERSGTQYVISDKYNQSNDNAFIQTCNIEAGTRANDSRETKLGHCNSIATDGTIFMVAPLWEWVNGSHTDTDKLYILTGSAAYDRYITAPEVCFGVSYDWITSKWYAIGYSGKVYTIDLSNSTFVEVDEISVDGMGVLQDAAVYDSVVYVSNIGGDLFTFSLETKKYNYAKVCDFDATGLYRLGEIDGMEFNNRGILLCIFDATNGEELVDNIFVCGLPINENTKLFSAYEIEPDVTNASYTQYVTPSSTNLHVFQNISIRNNFLGLKYINFEFTENATIDFLYADKDIVVVAGNHTITINNMRIRAAKAMFSSGTFVFNNPIQNYNPGAVVMFQVGVTVQFAASVTSWLTSGTWGTLLYVSGTYPTDKPLWANASKIVNANGFWIIGDWY